MNNKKVLITGVAGFIGFHLANYLLKKKYKVYGLDNLDNYYDIKIKQKRLGIIKKNKLFNFYKLDILDYKSLNKLFKNNKFKYVIHLAAQAGVRYSFKNPKKYIDTNITGFFNVINLSKIYKIKNFLYASSSSVYGIHKNKSSKETDEVNHPSSLYGATKRSNELIAHTYSHLYNLNTVGLRFFTVYGEFGRPDMSIFKFFRNILNFKDNFIFNNGNHYRSFTYVGDVVRAIHKIMITKIKKSNKKKIKLKADTNCNNNFNIINIGNENIVKLTDLTYQIENITGLKFRNKFLPLQKGDVVGSKASSKKLIKLYKFRFKTKINDGILKFYNWFKIDKKFNSQLKSLK